jgi:ribosomal-protein-serine acetyltransferase
MFSCIVDQTITLRLLQPHHAEELFAVVDQNRQHLRPWMNWVDTTRSPDDIREFIQSSLHRFVDVHSIICGIWCGDRYIGTVGLHDIDKINHHVEIGYWLSHSHQGKGIMTRSCERMIQYAFKELNLNRIVIKAAVENHRSRAIPERLGFTQEGTERQGMWVCDRYLDLVVYSLLAHEWSGRDIIEHRSY